MDKNNGSWVIDPNKILTIFHNLKTAWPTKISIAIFEFLEH